MNAPYPYTCPECGSSDYVNATMVEVCNACGYSVSYWREGPSAPDPAPAPERPRPPPLDTVDD